MLFQSVVSHLVGYISMLVLEGSFFFKKFEEGKSIE